MKLDNTALGTKQNTAILFPVIET